MLQKYYRMVEVHALLPNYNIFKYDENNVFNNPLGTSMNPKDTSPLSHSSIPQQLCVCVCVCGARWTVTKISVPRNKRIKF